MDDFSTPISDQIIIPTAEMFADGATFCGAPVGPGSDAARVVCENVRRRDEQWLARLRAVERATRDAERARCVAIVHSEIPPDDYSMGRGPTARAFDRVEAAIRTGVA